MTSPIPAAWPPAPGHPPHGYPPPPVTVGGYPLASPWERLGAKLIDGLVVGALFLPAAVLLYVVPFMVLITSAGKGTEPAAWKFVLLVVGFCLLFVVQALLLYAYEVSYQARRGPTVGKRALKLRIVTLAGGQPDLGTYRRRYLVANASQVAMAVPVLGWFVAIVGGFFQWLDALWCLWDAPYQQCLHDKYARTVVVKVPA